MIGVGFMVAGDFWIKCQEWDVETPFKDVSWIKPMICRQLVCCERIVPGQIV